MKARSNIQTQNTETRDSVEDVNRSFKSAVEVMAKSGYKMPNNITVSVDPNLPFMGYTMPTRRGFNIVVAGGAVGSGMLEGLLVHEMSHIYRIHTNHPSHTRKFWERQLIISQRKLFSANINKRSSMISSTIFRICMLTI